MGDIYPVLEHPPEVAVAAVVAQVSAVVGEAGAYAGVDPGSMFWSNCRRPGECSGYTYFHLPWLKLSPLGVRAIPATAAILAARMAFSNLVIRSLLK